MEHILGIDIGGSGIKGALVDLTKGEFVSDRIRINTPEGFSMNDVSAVIKDILPTGGSWIVELAVDGAKVFAISGKGRWGLVEA